MKKFVAFCLVIAFLFHIRFPVYAHTNYISSQYAITEQSGWKVNEDKHTNGLTAYYAFEAYNNNITSYMKSAVREGENRWAGTFTFYETSAEQTPYVLISTIEDVAPLGTDIGIYALATPINPNSSTGHVTRWKIYINLKQKIVLILL